MLTFFHETLSDPRLVAIQARVPVDPIAAEVLNGSMTKVTDWPTVKRINCVSIVL